MEDMTDLTPKDCALLRRILINHLKIVQYEITTFKEFAAYHWDKCDRNDTSDESWEHFETFSFYYKNLRKYHAERKRLERLLKMVKEEIKEVNRIHF